MNTNESPATPCPRCGNKLPPDAPGGVCPACAFGEALAEAPADGGADMLSLEDIPVPAGAEAAPEAPRAQKSARSRKAKDKPGDRIGRYKLLEEIGEGGCGVVYVAEQEQPVRRRVALKVIKLGMDTRAVIARFEAERQALALMDHPNIAKVLDAGATETGRPYFVMELVKGVSITKYCDDNRLSTTERLGLFVQVCQAIEHAHQKNIIHRDIKPSNILVTLHDGVPVPKVIDFGIAKATTNLRLTDKTVYTAMNLFIGTPAYMSPEQAELSGLDIDNRSDIYALGVLLYELLTGQTPFDSERFKKAAVDEIRRIIREEEPPRPSTRIGTLTNAEQTTVAKHRHSEPPKLQGIIRGDLDWIVMKTLEKDRTRRYETSSGLAADIQRYLSNDLVEARPPSPFYRFQKMVRRNKLTFAAGAVVIAALALGIAVATWQMMRAIGSEKVARAALVARREADAGLLGNRIENAAEVKDWATFTNCLSQFKKSFTDTAVGTNSHTRWGAIELRLHQLVEFDEREARAKLEQIQSVLNDGDPIRAHVLLSAFKKRFGATVVAATEGTNVSGFEARATDQLKAAHFRVGNEFTFYPSTIDPSMWRIARGFVEDFWTHYRPSNRGRRFGVFRVILEDEGSEDWLQVLAPDNCIRNGSSGGDGPGWGLGTITGIRSGGFVYFDPDELGQDWRFQVGSLCHYSPTLFPEYGQSNLVCIGTFVIHRLPRSATGRLAIRLQPESGLELKDARIEIGLFSNFPGLPLNFDTNGLCATEPIGSGTYTFRAIWRGGESTLHEIQVKAGQTADFAVPVYHRRLVKLEWMVRRAGKPKEWQRGVTVVSSGSDWSPWKQWEINQSVSVLSISPWDGGACYFQSGSCRWVPLKKAPEASEDLTPASNTQPLRVQGGFLGTVESFRVREGLILGTSYPANAENPEWEATIQVTSTATATESLVER